MRNWSALLAVVATIMLVVAGGPAVATAATCDPCPPDCPMMAPPSAAAIEDQGQAPAPSETPQTSACVQTVVCQAGAVAPPLAVGTLADLYVPRSTGKHDIVSDRAAPSRPPDRDLRPPIFL